MTQIVRQTFIVKPGGPNGMIPHECYGPWAILDPDSGCTYVWVPEDRRWEEDCHMHEVIVEGLDGAGTTVTVTPTTDPETGTVTYTVTVDVNAGDGLEIDAENQVNVVPIPNTGIYVDETGVGWSGCLVPSANVAALTPTTIANVDFVATYQTPEGECVTRQLPFLEVLKYLVTPGENITFTDGPNGEIVINADIPCPDEDGIMQDGDWVWTCVNGVRKLRQFIAPEYPTCVQLTVGEPTGAPVEGTGPWRADCDGNIWYYTCDNGGWVQGKLNIPQVSTLDPTVVTDICQTLNFYTWYWDGECLYQRQVTLDVLAEELQKCICSSMQEVPQDATHAMVCSQGEGGTTPGEFITRPLPSICTQLGNVPAGDPLSLSELNYVYDPETCTVRQVLAGTDCCQCYESDGFLAGGGVCFDVTAAGTQTDPAIFRGRDLSFIAGTGSNAFDLNGVGLLSALLTNPWADCACSARVTMRGLANRSLTDPGSGVGIIYMVSETLAEGLPYAGVTTSAGSPTSIFAYNPQNVSYLTLDVINNFDITPTNPGDTSDYSAFSSAPMIWETPLAPAATKPIYGQWWYLFAGPVTGLIGHASMQISVEYFKGGVINNPIQL